MRPFVLCCLVAGLSLWQGVRSFAADVAPRTGPETERRFPPLKVPSGFKATLFACDPLIEYPSVIAAGPRPGMVFVAVDYLTGLGTDIVRPSEVRLVQDTDGDGYADKATVFADGLNSIMGLAWHQDTLYVMHSPLLTAFRDTRGTGIADKRTDLINGLGLSPKENPFRLHCANGVTIGHDGWLYLALGDHGCDVRRPEGDRLVLEGGGILRCRPDGRDLHVFSSGLRNIYDVALDAELNVFVRDNENDGGDYKIRVCHSFFGADHGYPYLYYERPAEALPPIADLGLGSSAGGVCYLERHLPVEYRGNLLFCEWGKSVVRYPLQRAGSSFATPPEIEFAVGADDDPYGFKPTDVVVQRDGTLMVSDYADGQRPKRGRGRIYHIAHVGGAPVEKSSPAGDVVSRLDSESLFDRCEAQEALEGEGEKGVGRLVEALGARRIGSRGRLHAIWVLAHVQGAAATERLLTVAGSDPEAAVRAQAVRAVADLADPVLAQHRLDAGPGDVDGAARLAALNSDDPQVQLEVIIALGRLRWAGTADWLKRHLTLGDAALAHAAQQSLRQAGNWPAALAWLDAPHDDRLRNIALRAMSRQYDVGLIDSLLERLARETDSRRLRQYADCLAQVYKRPGPWVYWEYRPKPRPANPVAWDRTEAIAKALNRSLTSNDPETRLFVLQRMQREQIPVDLRVLEPWLREERDPERVGVMLESLRDPPAGDASALLELVIRDAGHSSANRLKALALLVRGVGEEQTGSLPVLVARLEDGPVLAEALRSFSKFPKVAVGPLLATRLDSPNAEVRAAAIEVLGELRADEGREPLLRLLGDQDAEVRRAAAIAAGKLEERRAIEPLLKLAADKSAPIRAASLESLRQLKESRAVPLAVDALGDRDAQQVALRCLRDLGGPDQITAVKDVALKGPPVEVLAAVVETLSTWRERSATTMTRQAELDLAVAEIQGASGSLVRWRLSGPIESGDSPVSAPVDGPIRFAAGTEGRVVVADKPAKAGEWHQAQTDVALSEPTDVEFLGSSRGRLEIWVDGKSIYRRDQSQSYRVDSDRVSTALPKGVSRVTVRVETVAAQSPVELQLHFRRKSAVAGHEQLLQAALSRPGDPEKGRAVFLNVEKSLCLKCHRIGDKGEKVGPELTGVGSRFSRIVLAESILQPSRVIAPSFGGVAIALKDGRVISGIKVGESEMVLELVDNQGQKQLIPRADIESQAASAVSAMPEGLERRISEKEFVDLVAFLAGQKEIAKAE